MFHVLVTMVLTAVIVVVPVMLHIGEIMGNGQADVVSGASMKLPEKPSGEYIVIVNRSLHEDSLEDWKTFFTGKDLPVIFDDISCIVSQADSGGMQMAQRYQAQLPENQMKLRTEDLTLLVSKAESGYIDAAVFSKEIAQAMKLSTEKCSEKSVVIEVKTG